MIWIPIDIHQLFQLTTPEASQTCSSLMHAISQWQSFLCFFFKSLLISSSLWCSTDFMMLQQNAEHYIVPGDTWGSWYMPIPCQNSVRKHRNQSVRQLWEKPEYYSISHSFCLPKEQTQVVHFLPVLLSNGREHREYWGSFRSMNRVQISILCQANWNTSKCKLYCFAQSNSPVPPRELTSWNVSLSGDQLINSANFSWLILRWKFFYFFWFVCLFLPILINYSSSLK